MGFSGEFVLEGLGDERLGDERAERCGVAMATLVATIAASPIVVTADSTATAASQRDVPAGFDAIDIAILDWIAAEGRRAGRRLLRM
jgi:hypothetical protein